MAKDHRTRGQYCSLSRPKEEGGPSATHDTPAGCRGVGPHPIIRAPGVLTSVRGVRVFISAAENFAASPPSAGARGMQRAEYGCDATTLGNPAGAAACARAMSTGHRCRIG